MPGFDAEARNLEMHALAELTLKEADPAALRFVVDKSKHAGNDAFKHKRYNGEAACIRASVAFSWVCVQSNDVFCRSY
jgi:hypothetical protein